MLLLAPEKPLPPPDAQLLSQLNAPSSLRPPVSPPGSTVGRSLCDPVVVHASLTALEHILPCL